jgi:hypothetical protein
MKMNFQDLIDKGLVKQKRSAHGLRVLKYARKVFYDNLWHLDSRLLEARGLVLDDDDNVIVRPFTKVFNYGENGTTIERDTLCTVVRKVNGFLGCVTKTEKYGTLYSTTGSLDSDFAQLVAKHVDDSKIMQGFTYLFEICDASDPHIVEEQEGAYLIGCRCVESGICVTEHGLDILAREAGWHRPMWRKQRFSDIVLESKVVKHEGFMVYGDCGTALKIKSPHYLGKKFLMRMGDGKVDQLFENPQAFRQTIDEEFYAICDKIVELFEKEQWKAMSDQERRVFVEEYFSE